MSLAIFDLDNTLLGGDSDHSWGDFLAERNIVGGADYLKANDAFYEDYKRGELDIHAYVAFALEPLFNMSTDELAKLHREFMADKIEPLILPKAMALIESHRERGDELLIITATNSFITAPIATRLGIPNLLATDPEIVNGKFTGRISGTPCFQDGKVERLKTWIANTPHQIETSYFYSDSFNDLPLLNAVGFPFAVDPDETLRHHAQTHDWPIISLRETP